MESPGTGAADLRTSSSGASLQSRSNLGKKEGKDLVYMGKVGTGWSRTVSSQIRKQLDTVVSPKFNLNLNQAHQEA